MEPRYPRLVDTAIALAVLAVMAAGTAAISRPDSPDVSGWALLLLAAGTLVVRRSWPVPVMWFVIAAGLSYTLLGNPGGFYTVVIAVGIFTVAADGRRWWALAGLAAAFILFLAAAALVDTGHEVTGASALYFVGWLTVGYLLGEVVRSRRDYVRALQERAVEAE